MKYTSCDRCHISTQGLEIKITRFENSQRDLCPDCIKLVRVVYDATLKAPAKIQFLKSAVKLKAGICDDCGSRSAGLIRGICPDCRE